MTNFTSYEAIYGAFAALPIFLLWIYLSWNVILLGVEISYTLTIFDPDNKQPAQPVLSLLSMLDLTYQRHKSGQTVSEHEQRGKSCQVGTNTSTT
jgi:membrane protein